MDLNSRYEELTFGDVLPIDGCVLWNSTRDVDVYLIREGGVYKMTKFHKTAKSVMEANAEEAKGFSRTGKLGTSVKVASMPTSLYLELHAKGITQDQAGFKRFLNNPDNIGFCTNDLRL